MTALARPRTARAFLPVVVTLLAAGSARADELTYKFTLGQTFAYRLELVSDSGGGAERFAGTPVFMVKEVEKGGDATLSVVGKLDYATRPRGGAAFTTQPGMEAWIGSRVNADAQGHKVHGRKDSVYGPLPAMLQELVPLKQLPFVELPFGRNDTYVNSGSATLWQHGKGGFVPIIATTKGYRTLTVRAEAHPAGGIRLTKERSFHTTQGPKREWKYRGTSRFDPARGLVVETDATYTDDDLKTPIKITVRLLTGDDLKRAQKQATADAARRPPEQDPVEDRRVRLDLKSPTRIKTTTGLKRKTAVAHMNDSDYKWYLAEVDEVLSEYKVAIRYKGSKEEFDVHVAQLAYPPGAAGPKK